MRQTVTAAQHSPAGAANAEEIYERILAAITEHRLQPGAKLREDKLAKIFGVSRARIRQVLARLAHERVVTLFPNRGAFVAKPTVEQAREIFEARRLIEPGLIRRLMASPPPARLERLRQHVTAEAQARAANDRRAMIRLSGEFHMLIGEMAGNALLTEVIRELTSLSCLIIVLYSSSAVPACRHYEHRAIVDGIAGGDADQAVRLMLEHLDNVESNLELTSKQPETTDLEAVFS